MKNPARLTSTFAIIIGIFLLIEGIWGLSSGVVFGIFTTNIFHAIIHIILGIVGLVLGIRQHARGFCIFLGILLIVVGILRFTPVASDIVITLLNVNIAVACLNILIGILSLAVSYAPKVKAQAVKP